MQKNIVEYTTDKVVITKANVVITKVEASDFQKCAELLAAHGQEDFSEQHMLYLINFYATKDAAWRDAA